MSAARIIGVGSPFGADRIGWEAVDELGRPGGWEGLPPGRVVFSRCARPDHALLEEFAKPGLLVLVDAMRSGRPAGTVCCLPWAQFMRSGSLISTHNFGIKSALNLAAALGAMHAEVLLCGIEIPLESMPAACPSGAAPDTAGERGRKEILNKIKRVLIPVLRKNGYL